MPIDPAVRRRNRIARILERAASSRNWAIASEEQARAKIDQQLAWMHRANEMADSGIASRRRELLALGFGDDLVDQVMIELDSNVRSGQADRSDLSAVGQRYAELLLERYAASRVAQADDS